MTSDIVKLAWVNRLPAPPTLDKNYHETIKYYNKYIGDIRKGVYDMMAKEVAANYNKSLAVEKGGREMVQLQEEVLQRIDEEKRYNLEKEAIREQRMQNIYLQQLQRQSSSILREMQNINNQIR